MKLQIKINCPDAENDLNVPYLTWSPAICHVKLEGNKGDQPIFLETVSNGKGRAKFTNESRTELSDTYELTLQDQEWSSFYITGEYGYASIKDKDIKLNIYKEKKIDKNLIASTELMVRVRKDAETLTEEERERFLIAFSKLNKEVLGANYKEFTQMHIANTDNEIHMYENFLPWHRLYLLNLERELQRIDPSVALHYWRWDNPAPKLFSADFAGEMHVVQRDKNKGNRPYFSISNPWRDWQTGGAPLLRSAFMWDLRKNGGYDVLVNRETPEDVAINMGAEGYSSLFWDTKRVRGSRPGYIFSTPHGGAHMSFRGQISDIASAPQDPVFFMLHSNVDRIWALWQNKWDRFDPTCELSYSPQGTSGNRELGFGAYSEETQWPWNGDGDNPRPPQAPYGEFPTKKKGYHCLPLPTPTPKNSEVIDYKGKFSPLNSIGFDYDDVVFHHEKSKDSNLTAKEMEASDNLKTYHENVPTLKQIVNTLKDYTQPDDLREEMMTQVRVLAFEGVAFTRERSIILPLLRELIDDKNTFIAAEAIDLLAYEHDEYLQRRLVEGLENDSAKLVNDETAIYYLSLDSHNFLELIRKVALNSERDQETRIMAIKALAIDTSVIDELISILKDKQEVSEIREAAANTLQALDTDLLIENASDIIKNSEDQDDHLQTILLFKFTLLEDKSLAKIRSDKELISSIYQFVNRTTLSANGDAKGNDINHTAKLKERLNSIL